MESGVVPHLGYCSSWVRGRPKVAQILSSHLSLSKRGELAGQQRVDVLGEHAGRFTRYISRNKKNSILNYLVNRNKSLSNITPYNFYYLLS